MERALFDTDSRLVSLALLGLIVGSFALTSACTITCIVNCLVYHLFSSTTWCLGGS